MFCMGIDMGTSGCKAVVFDENWKIVCSAYREYSLIFPGEGLLELDPETVWDKIVQVIREVNATSEKPVEALAISAIGDVILPLFKDGTPVRNSIIDFDPRGSEQIKRFADDFGSDEFFNITGMPPVFIGSLAKILWYQEYEPATFARVERWGTYEDYIVQKLGLEPWVSYSEAARTMMFDIRKKSWSRAVLEKIPLDESVLPKPVKSGVRLGEVDQKIAVELGFKKPITVVSGGHDMVCAAIGAGLDERRSEIAVDIAGTIEGIVAAMMQPNTGKTMLDNLFPCYPGFEGFVTFSVNLTAGSIFRWFRDVIAKDTYKQCLSSGENYFAKTGVSLSIDSPGNLIFIPHFSGSGNPDFNPLARGLIYGLTLDTSREDIFQAMAEGLCFELRAHADALKKASIHFKTLRAVGGGSRNDRELQLKASITGLEIIKGGVTESSALGAASLAGLAMGIISHPSEAFRTATKNEKRFSPDPATTQRFESAFRRYVKLEDQIRNYEIQTD